MNTHQPGTLGAGLRRLSGRSRIREAIQDEIMRYIAENALSPGARLPSEGSIARVLGVGRNSVREAIISLKALGVIDVQAGSGLSVRDLDFVPVHDYFALVATTDFQSIKYIRELRMFIELGLVERLIERRTQRQLQRIEAILKRFEGTAASGRYAVELDRAFHEAIWERIANPVISRVLGIFWDVVEQAHARDVLLPPSDTREHAAIHRSIYDALSRGHADDLRRAILVLFHDPKSQASLNPSLKPQPAASTNGAKPKNGARISLEKARRREARESRPPRARDKR